jgi:two-component system, OmpR family, response regulator
MNKQKKRILVVDDETSITTLLKMNLEQTDDYEVQVENNSVHAITAAKEFKPDLILMDVLMPGIGGGELASRLQAIPQFEKVPIVFLTAVATKREVSEHGGLLGGLPFLAKPVEVPEVVTCVRQYLHN